MRKSFVLLLGLCLLSAFLFSCGNTPEKYFKFEMDEFGNGLKVSANHDLIKRDKLTTIKIPSTCKDFEGLEVIKIGIFAGLNCIKTVKIPDTVTSIGEYAFHGCTGLTEITIPNSVTFIGDSAFFGCTGLKKVTIPNSVEMISVNAFRNCTGLKKITIPDSVIRIDGSAFNGCTGLTEITIPDSVKEIWQNAWLQNDEAFAGCTNLKKISISKSLYDWIQNGDGRFWLRDGYGKVFNGLKGGPVIEVRK